MLHFFVLSARFLLKGSQGSFPTKCENKPTGKNNSTCNEFIVSHRGLSLHVHFSLHCHSLFLFTCVCHLIFGAGACRIATKMMGDDLSHA